MVRHWEAVWTVIQSTPLPKSVFLNSILEKRFPTCTFDYFKFSTLESSKKDFWKKTQGVVSELKSLAEDSLKVIDKLMRETKGVPHIMILTPHGYQLLQRKRKSILDQVIIVLSETKSLDYLLQIPRFMEEIGLKARLRAQNEKLYRLIEQKLNNPLMSDDVRATAKPSRPEVIEEIFSNKQDFGLRIHIREWKTLKKNLGGRASAEISEALTRAIQQAVRNSDRVLHSKDDEFVVLFSKTEIKNIEKCRQRISNSLKAFEIKANQKSLRIPFRIGMIEPTLSAY